LRILLGVARIACNPGGRSPQEVTTQRSPRRSIWPNVPAAAALVDFVDPDCKQSGPPRLRNSPSAILLVDSQRCSDELSYRSQTANCTPTLVKDGVRLDAGSVDRLFPQARSSRTLRLTPRFSSRDRVRCTARRHSERSSDGLLP
jgi:hypothetical protein